MGDDFPGLVDLNCEELAAQLETKETERQEAIAEAAELRTQIGTLQLDLAAQADQHAVALSTMADTLADRDRQISELHEALAEQGRLNETIPLMRTQLLAHEDTIGEQNRTIAAMAIAHRESEARLLQGNADAMRAAGVSDEHDDTFGTAIGTEVVGSETLAKLQARASLDGLTVADEILALLDK